MGFVMRVVRLTDTGCGIAEDLIPHAFRPFVSSKPASKGTGLAIVHNFVLSGGGSVEIETRLTVTMRLPGCSPSN